MQRRETYILKLLSSDETDEVTFSLHSATSDEHFVFNSIDALMAFLEHRPLPQKPQKKDNP